MERVEFQSRLHALLDSQGALPYLFIGSGISMRYLGLPDWQGLLRHFAEIVGVEYDYLAASAAGDYPEIARLLAERFHEPWWTDARFESSRQRNTKPTLNRESALKIAVSQFIEDAQQLHAGCPGVDKADLAHEIELLRDAVVDGVITTNYDSLTDQLFPDFKPYVGQDELMLSDAQFVAEVYKIHGSVTNPESLVLTASDYADFSRRGAYLAAKLLTIFAEHPVIFLGYSITDKYIQELLDNVATAIGPSRLSALRDRLIFVERDTSATEPSMDPSTMAIGSFRLPILRVTLNDFSPLYTVLANLKRPFPANVLRELRKFVYDLVTEPDPNRESVTVVPMEAPGADNFRVVFGVGVFSASEASRIAELGFRGISRTELALDILGVGGVQYDAENVVKVAVPSIRSRSGGTPYVPVFKYLAELGRVADDGTIDTSGLPSAVVECVTSCRDITLNRQQRERFERDVEGQYLTPGDLLASGLPLYVRMDAMLALDPATFPLTDYETALKKLKEESDGTSYESAWWKVLCRYDFLQFGAGEIRAA